jgi:hypothetical protein
LRDKLYDRMCDWNFHTLEELDGWMPEREWVRAMLDLLHFGWAFDRRGKTLRLRKALVGEPRQSVVDLLSGITVANTVGEESGVVQVVTDGEGGVEGDSPFPPGGEEGDDVAPEDEMVLDEERTMILSAPEFVPETCGILARKGRGKTYLAMVLAEELLKSEYEIPFVVVDPTGCWYGLLSDVLGEPSENRIALLGGERGHYPLPATAGRLAARTVIACRPLPVILDLSLMEISEQHGFVADFGEELYHRNLLAVHLFFDEADIFAPQKLDKASRQHGRCLAAMDTLIRRGRFRGIGDTLVSQRPAVVNKNLLSQVGAMFFLQLGAPQDLSAVGDWLHTNIRREVRDACLEELPVLGKGVSYYLRGGDRPMFRKFKVRSKTTFDSSHTPEFKEKAVVAEIGDLSAEDRATLDECYGKEVAGLVAARVVSAPVESPVEAGAAGAVREAAVGLEDAGSQELAASLGVQHGDDGVGLSLEERVLFRSSSAPKDVAVREESSCLPEEPPGFDDDEGQRRDDDGFVEDVDD